MARILSHGNSPLRSYAAASGAILSRASALTLSSSRSSSGESGGIASRRSNRIMAEGNTKGRRGDGVPAKSCALRGSRLHQIENFLESQAARAQKFQCKEKPTSDPHHRMRSSVDRRGHPNSQQGEDHLLDLVAHHESPHAKV